MEEGGPTCLVGRGMFVCGFQGEIEYLSTT